MAEWRVESTYGRRPTAVTHWERGIDYNRGSEKIVNMLNTMGDNSCTMVEGNYKYKKGKTKMNLAFWSCN
jgi:hypothetical protein